MRFGVLGPLSVETDDGEPVTIPGAKVRALLADLLLHPGRLLSADRLVDDLWGDRLPANPNATLQGKVSQLRRALGDAEPGGGDLVRYRAPGYLLDVGPEAIDAGRFESLVERARAILADDAQEALRLLGDALALWRGPALAEFVDEPFARPAISHLEEHRLTAVEARVEARLATGHHGPVTGELEALLADHPLRERLRALHMRALYGAGRQAEAIASYEELRTRLADELGLDPGRELADLHQTILQQDPSLDAPPVTPPRPRTNVAAPRTPLVGGEASADRVAGLLASNRIVTLTGPGGVGKTRTAVEAGRRALARHPGGVWMVDLAAHEPSSTDGSRLAEHVADVLGVRDEAGGRDPGDGTGNQLVERIARAVADQPTLLLLDNCERVLADTAELVDRLVASAAGLRVLATSRLPLEVSGEQLWPVTPLAVPEDGAAARDPGELERFDAVRLFTTRAAAATPDFAVTPENAAAVAAICRRLDGLPLALELAAARLRALSVGDLAARLDDQLRVLAGGPRSAPERQQTLRALVDWSWDLLTEREQKVLARLSVFSGAAPLPAVEAVAAGDGIEAADVLDIVARLVDHSLLAAETGDGTRYRMLETIRSYALARLEEMGEQAIARRRHAECYAELAEAADAHLRGHEQQRWLERLDAETANVRAAVDWATGADPSLALRLANALAWYLYLRGRPGQACRQLARALRDDADPPARAKALAWLGSLGTLDRSVEDPTGHGRAALELYTELDRPSEHDRPSELDRSSERDRPSGLATAPERDRTSEQARAKLLLSGLLIQRREPPHTERLVGEALEAFEHAGDEWGMAGALTVRGWLGLESGDPVAARRDGDEAHALYRRLGDRWGQIRAAELLAQVAELHGDYDRAAGLHRSMLEMAEALQLWASVALELGRLGRVVLLTGDEPQALALHERALQLSRELAFEQGTAFARVGLGLVLRRQGRLAEAEEHLRAVLDWHEGRGFDSGVAFCLTQLGFVAELGGDPRRARALHRDAFDAAHRGGDRRAVALALEGLAGAAAADGDAAEAATLLGAATGIRAAAGAHLPPAERRDVDRIAARAAAALGDDVYADLFGEGESTPFDEVRPTQWR